MEQVTRIELALAAWKAVVLPLNHTCINGRENRIRTCDILVPNQALYQAELFPDNAYNYITIQINCQYLFLYF